MATASIAVVAAPASAQPTNDVRCLLASNFFMKAAKDEKVRRLAEAAMYFYLGRIQGRLNATQLKAALAREQKALNAANAGPTMNNCTKNMQVSAELLQRIGKELAAGR